MELFLFSSKSKIWADYGFKALLEKAKQRDSFWAAKTTQEFTEALFGLMQRRGVTRAELARRIDRSPAYVTKALCGNTNFTIETMVRLVRALDGQLCVHVAPREERMHWFNVLDGEGCSKGAVRQSEFHHVAHATVAGQAQNMIAVHDTDAAAA